MPYSKEYYKVNIDYFVEKSKNYYELNKHAVLEKNKRWFEKNREKVYAYKNERLKRIKEASQSDKPDMEIKQRFKKGKKMPFTIIQEKAVLIF